MSRKFTDDEKKWGGSWGLIGPIADFTAQRVVLPDPPFEILPKPVQQLVIETRIRQSVNYAKFAVGQLQENIEMWEKGLALMKRKG